MIFKFSEEFLQFVRGYYYNPANMKSAVEIIDDMEVLTKLSKDGLATEYTMSIFESYYKFVENRDISSEKMGKNSNRYSTIFEAHQKELRDVFNVEAAGQMLSNIAIDCIENGGLAARVIMSPCKKYLCIVVSAGLVDLLHKRGKLIYAMNDPESVIYFSRSPGKKPNIDELFKVRDDMIEAFEETGRIHGPIIHLDEETQSRHIHQLCSMERFLICHELAHVLNGDLSGYFDNSVLQALNYNSVDNEDHRKEYRADLVGFTMLLIWEHLIYPGDIDLNQLNIIRINLAFCMKELFDSLSEFAPGASEAHPLPEDRVLHIVENFLGPVYLELFADLYNPSVDPVHIMREIFTGNHPIDGIEEKMIPFVLMKMNGDL